MRLAERLRVELDNGPVAAAFAIWNASASDEELVATTNEAAGIAGNAGLGMPERVAALLVVALLAQTTGTVPELALDVLDDDLLIDAVIDTGATAAITGVIAAAGERVADRVRRYIAVRLVAARITGAHVAALQLALGDLDGTARSIAPTLVVAVTEVRSPRGILALTSMLVRWTDEHGRPLAQLIAGELAPEICGTFADAARTIGIAEDQPLVAVLESRARQPG